MIGAFVRVVIGSAPDRESDESKPIYRMGLIAKIEKGNRAYKMTHYKGQTEVRLSVAIGKQVKSNVKMTLVSNSRATAHEFAHYRAEIEKARGYKMLTKKVRTLSIYLYLSISLYLSLSLSFSLSISLSLSLYLSLCLSLFPSSRSSDPHSSNPYGDTLPSTSSSSSSPLSGRAYIWLSTGNSNGLDARPPFQRIYRKLEKLFLYC